MIRIVQAKERNELDEVRKLIHRFVEWHRQRHLQDIALIDSYFDQKAFEEELATLPGKYTPPEGSLLLAYINDEPAGCVALRKIDDLSCEMKRMFVYEQFHGTGVGKALSKHIIEDARSAGYKKMRLDTSIRQKEAQTLYEKMGFNRIEAYYDLPEDLRNWLVFMELDLSI